MMNDNGVTALHWACENRNDNSMEIILRMLEMGGKELLMMNDGGNNTVLHWACINENASMEIISKLLEMGGREMLMMNHSYYGNTALHTASDNKMRRWR